LGSRLRKGKAKGKVGERVRGEKKRKMQGKGGKRRRGRAGRKTEVAPL